MQKKLDSYFIWFLRRARCDDADQQPEEKHKFINFFSVLQKQHVWKVKIKFLRIRKIARLIIFTLSMKITTNRHQKVPKPKVQYPKKLPSIATIFNLHKFTFWKWKCCREYYNLNGVLLPKAEDNPGDRAGRDILHISL